MNAGDVLTAAPAGAVRAVNASFWGTLSAVCRDRVFHPEGVGFEAELSIDRRGAILPRARILRRGSTHRAVVRLSRGAGLPEPAPDILGLAIKLPDVYGERADQDFLLVTSGSGPVVQHLLLPARGFLDLPFSSILPFRAGGRLVLFGALPPAGGGTGPGLRELRHRSRGHRLRYRFAISSPTGSWRPIGRLELGRRLDDHEAEALRFNPWNCGGGIAPAGLLNRLRDSAYRGSQFGRPV